MSEVQDCREEAVPCSLGGNQETESFEEPFIIDLHSHFLPDNLPDFSTRYGYTGFVSLETPTTSSSSAGYSSGKGFLKKGNKILFEVPSTFWDISARYEYLQENNINMQILSPPSSILSYWAKADDTADLCRILNNSLKKETEKYPNHFIPLCVLPLQAIELALLELERCIKLGFKGCVIGTSINNYNLDSPELFPFYEFCEENQFPIFIHSISDNNSPTSKIQRKNRKYWLTSLIGNVQNINRSILTLLLGGVLEHFPKLKIFFYDGGGSFPYLLGNFEQAYFYKKKEVGNNSDLSPKEYLRQKKVFVDSNVCSKESLELLVKVIGEDNVLYGSNYPFIPSAVAATTVGMKRMGEHEEEQEMRFIEEGSFFKYLKEADNVTEESEKKILGRNAIKFLNLTEEEVAKARFPKDKKNM